MDAQDKAKMSGGEKSAGTSADKAEKGKNPHVLHRKRVKARFLKEGLRGFEKHQVLEMLLFYTIPQGDVNETAHRLLEKFHNSLFEVFNAPIEDLKQVDGVGEHTAVFLKMIPQLFAVYEDDMMNRKGVSGHKEIMRYIFTQLCSATVEKVMLVCVDSKFKMLGYEIISEGTVSSSIVNNRKIVEACLRHNATAAILAHNHPRGFSEPSRGDVQTTDRVRSMLLSIGVTLLDHVIVSPDNAFSMRLSEDYSYLFR